MDSVTIFNTYNIPEGQPIGLLCFSPDCKHCKAFFKELLPKMDSLKNIQFYIFTAFSQVSQIRRFYDENHLGDYKNIKVVGRDYEFFFHDFFKVTVVPDLALYDSHKKLVKLFEGAPKISEVYAFSSKL